MVSLMICLIFGQEVTGSSSKLKSYSACVWNKMLCACLGVYVCVSGCCAVCVLADVPVFSQLTLR